MVATDQRASAFSALSPPTRAQGNILNEELHIDGDRPAREPVVAEKRGSALNDTMNKGDVLAPPADELGCGSVC